MALAAGEQIGHYKVQSLIGKGGMGEVYRAIDTKLEREVAIKVLPAALASDPDRLARFEREAKVLAQLNHPGIAAIHGVEDRALVMDAGSDAGGPDCGGPDFGGGGGDHFAADGGRARIRA